MPKKNSSPRNRKANGQFTKGTSGNPAGRPRGSRNKSTRQLLELLGEDAEKHIKQLKELLAKGDRTAMRIYWERVLPRTHDQPISIDLPPIENLADLAAANRRIIEAATNGEIGLGAAQKLLEILQPMKEVFSLEEQRRLKEEEFETALAEVLEEPGLAQK